MQENTKQVIVKMTARRAFRTEPIWQYDVGHELVFEGFDLPGAFEVHFSLSPMGKSITQVGQDGVCVLPDMYAQTAAPIYAWLYIADEETGLTKYSIEIPVQRRAKPTDQQPTPVQQSAIDQAIAALNDGVEAAEDAQEAAEAAQTGAETAQGQAEDAAARAANSAIDADSSRRFADQHATAAQVAQGKAETAQTKAETAQGKAEAAQAAAEAAVGSYDAMTATATTLQPGSSATAEIDRTGDHPVLQLGLPQGEAGATPDFSIGTVSTLQPGQDATATITGTAAAPLLNLGIPQGDPGDATIDDTAGVGDTTKVWSADKSATETNSLKSVINDKADVIINTASGDIASFDDGADGMPIKGIAVAVEPVQDLHGYDNPWPAGGGKNKFLPDSSYDGAHNGITFTTQSDGKVLANGTLSSNLDQVIGYVNLPAGTYILNGCPSGGGSSAYGLQVTDYPVHSSLGFDYGSGVSFTLDTAMDVAIRVRVRTNLSNVLFAPMIRLSSESDGTFAPYSNDCPITGHTAVTVTRTGINLLDISHAVTGERFNANGTTSFGNNVRSEYIPVKPNTAYYFKNVRGLATMAPVWWYDKDKVNLSYANVGGTDPSSGVLTSPANAAYVGVNFAPGYTDSVAVNYPSTETEYSSGSLGSDTIQLGQTVYGGTLDPVAGVLRVESVFHEFDGTEGASIIKQVGSTSGLVRLNLNAFGDNAVRNTQTASIVNENCLKSNMLVVSTASAWTSAPVGGFGVITGIPWIKPREEVFADAEAVLTWMAQQKTAGTPLQVMLELATPTEIPVDPVTITTLLGSNRIWADTGSVSVDYCADTKTYVDSNESVKDVQVNGTSVVTDGVANVPVHSIPSGGSSGQVLAKTSGTNYAVAWVDANPVQTVSGTTPTITALPGVRYVCGEVATLDVTVPASGIVDVVFESGSTATVLTITGNVRWANGFDPTALDANTTYEINIADGLGVAASWT